MPTYTKKELDELLNKEVEIILGDEDDDDTFSFKGKLIGYTMSSEDYDKVDEFCFHTNHGAIKKFNIANLKEVRLL